MQENCSRFFHRVLETEHSFFKPRILYKQTEQMQFVLSINKVLESVEELPLSTKKLSQVKTCDNFLVEKLKKAKELGKEKTFH